jgi:hypothetical protein
MRSTSLLGRVCSLIVFYYCPLEDVTPGQVIGWIVARPETLTLEAQEQLDQLCQMDSTLAQHER